MPTRLRKVRRLRGSRTHGWGQIGQHRPHGSKGGRGMAGGHKHRWTWVLKHEPDYFGEKGFTPPLRREKRSVNLTSLSLIAERIASSPEARYEDDRLLIDLRGLGIEKVIGGGRLTRSLKILAESWSRGAERKIAESGSIIVKPG